MSAKVTGKDFSLQIFVINSTVTENLPGREAATRMGLIKRVDTVEEPVFGDLNEQPIKCQPVKAQLTGNAQAYSISTARRVPIPLFGKVKEELTQNEN